MDTCNLISLIVVGIQLNCSCDDCFKRLCSMIYSSLIKANKSCYFVWIDFEWQISRTRPVADYGIKKKKKKKKG